MNVRISLLLASTLMLGLAASPVQATAWHGDLTLVK